MSKGDRRRGQGEEELFARGHLIEQKLVFRSQTCITKSPHETSSNICPFQNMLKLNRLRPHIRFAIKLVHINA